MSLLKVNNITDLGNDAVVTSGVLDTLAVPAGGILQVVSTTKTDTFSESTAANTESAIITGFTASITPSSTSSKILVIYSLHMASDANWMRLGNNLYRDTTAIAVGDTAGSRKRITSYSGAVANNDNDMNLSSVTYLDSPNTTSALTYGVKLYNISGSTRVLYVNRTSANTNSANVGAPVSTITLMEVAG